MRSPAEKKGNQGGGREARGQIQCGAPGKLFEQLWSRAVGDTDPCCYKISLQSRSVLEAEGKADHGPRLGDAAGESATESLWAHEQPSSRLRGPPATGSVGEPTADP